MNPFYDLHPGQSFDVIFPEGFTLEYTHSVYINGDLVKITTAVICERMNSWYWDDDDHCCLDHYFYGVGADNHFAKFYNLTEASRDKVLKFVSENYK